MKSMDRIINRFTLLCVVIFGLCEAHWKMEDDWMKNAPPVSKQEIEARANQSLLNLEEDLGESVELVQSALQQCQEELVKEKENNYDIQNEMAEIKKKILITHDHAERIELHFQLSLLRSQFNSSSEVILQKFMTISQMESILHDLDEQNKTRIADIEYRKQQSLFDSEKGINTKSRVQIDKPTLSIDLNVPHGQTVINVKNDGWKKRRFDPIRFRIENPRSIFQFYVDMEGVFHHRVPNNTHIQGEILPGIELQCRDDDDALDRPRYKVSVDNDSTRKTVAYFNPDGTIEVHETIDELRNDVFKQRNRIWKYENKVSIVKWSLLNSSEQYFDLNDPKEEVILGKFCQSSLTVKKLIENVVISEKRLICKNE